MPTTEHTRNEITKQRVPLKKAGKTSTIFGRI